MPKRKHRGQKPCPSCGGSMWADKKQCDNCPANWNNGHINLKSDRRPQSEVNSAAPLIDPIVAFLLPAVAVKIR